MAQVWPAPPRVLLDTLIRNVRDFRKPDTSRRQVHALLQRFAAYSHSCGGAFRPTSPAAIRARSQSRRVPARKRSLAGYVEIVLQEHVDKAQKSKSRGK